MGKIKKHLVLVLALLIVLAFPNTALANDIESIDIEAQIQDDGSVIVREHRIFNATEGTEHYLPFANLGESEIINFKVFENGDQLEDIGDWDIDASIDEKRGKSGINYTSDGLELCFGIGSLGKKDFTIEYTITNFVRELEDGKQAIYWQFINPDMDPIGKVNIAVGNKKGFIYKYPETKIWGFGFDGKSEIADQALMLKAENGISSSEYMVLMSILPEGTFQTSAYYPYTEESLKELAMQGATINEKPDSGDYNPSNEDDYLPPQKTESVFPRLGHILGPILGYLPMVLIVNFFLRKARGNSRDPRKNYVATVGREFYYRDLPYQGYIPDVGSLIKADTKNYISALILKWIQEERLVDQKEMTGFIFKKERLALLINQHAPNITDSLKERELWDMVVEASGDDGVLSEKEFTRYMSRNISTFNKWTQSLESQSKKTLVNQGYLDKKERNFLFIPITDYLINDKGQTLLNNITGFKNYLRDFSLVDEREVGDAKLWDKYMIWAAMLGITEEVYEQLKIVNPEMIEDMNYDMTTIVMTNNFARSIMSTQSSLNTSHSYSGGGGATFSGGGGGASGGSSGGGTR